MHLGRQDDARCIAHAKDAGFVDCAAFAAAFVGVLHYKGWPIQFRQKRDRDFWRNRAVYAHAHSVVHKCRERI